MLSGMPAGEIVSLAVMVIGAGLVTGFAGGLLGIGGASITVPVLYELFGVMDVPDTVRMQLCVGTSLAIIIPLSIRSFLAHRAHSAVLGNVLRVWTVPVVVGVLTGAFAAYFAPAGLFKFVFMAFCLMIGLRYLLGNSSLRVKDHLPGNAALAFVGYLIGLISSLIGIAGGSASTLFLTTFGQSIHVAIATSSGLGVLISIPGTIGYMIAGWPQQAQLPPLSVGYVSFLGLLLYAPAGVLAAPYGARVAHKLSRRRLEVIFGLFLVAVAIRFLFSLF